jgi:hypothetical protein
MHAPISKIEHSGTRSKGHLLRILGVGFGVAVIVGNTIGSGILLTPGEVAAHLRNPWLIFAAWSAGGVFAFFCTQSVAELGTMLPQAGGWFVYARRAFGEYGGFLTGCCDWMVQSAAIAYLAAAFGEFAADLTPVLRGHTKAAAVACLIALMLLNWLGLRTGSQCKSDDHPTDSVRNGARWADAGLGDVDQFRRHSQRGVASMYGSIDRPGSQRELRDPCRHGRHSLRSCLYVGFSLALYPEIQPA